MNQNVRDLLSALAYNNYSRARQYASVILNQATSAQDIALRDKLLPKFNGSELELPPAVQGILEVQQPDSFPDYFLERTVDTEVVNTVLRQYSVAKQLQERNIRFSSTLLLYGEPGTGKTMLARYLAKRVGLPFVRVKFSMLMSSLLGATQQNIAKIFNFVKTTPCVLCFDELDAIGMSRSKSQDVGEMSRIVISLMQELDSLPTDVLLIGTTNRFGDLDAALLRRFTLLHRVLRLTDVDARMFANNFFQAAGYKVGAEPYLVSWIQEEIEPSSVADIEKQCIMQLVSMMTEEERNEVE